MSNWRAWRPYRRKHSARQRKPGRKRHGCGRAGGAEKRPGVSDVFPGRIGPGVGGKAPFSGLTVPICRQMRDGSPGCITMQVVKNKSGAIGAVFRVVCCRFCLTAVRIALNPSGAVPVTDVMLNGCRPAAGRDRMCNCITAHARPDNYHLVRALPRHPGVRYILSPGRVIGDVNNAGVSHPKKRPVTILQICLFFSHKSGSFSL